MMPQKKISELPPATSVGADDVVPLVQGGESKRLPVRVLGRVPPGAIETFPLGAVPADRLECDGRAVSRTDYAALYAAIGTSWGSGDGATTFNVPRLPRRHLAGFGGTSTITVMVPQPSGPDLAVDIAVAILVTTIKA